MFHPLRAMLEERAAAKERRIQVRQRVTGKMISIPWWDRCLHAGWRAN